MPWQKNLASAGCSRGYGMKKYSRLKRMNVGDWLIVVMCTFLIMACFFPVMSFVARSLSSSDAIMLGQVTIFPVEINFDAYETVITDSRFMRALIWTIILTAIFTITAMSLTVMCAFPLTFERLRGRKFFTFMIIFTMFFGAGTIPTYLLYRDLGLLNNPLVLILPGSLSVFNMIIMRSFFFNIPVSLKESAAIDGANPITILLKIYLPLSTAVLATLSLFYAVGRWNGFSDALMFMQDRRFHPIQLLLYNILQNIVQVGDAATFEGFVSPGRPETLRSASVVVAMIPILMIYPWLQRYFISGATLGAIKE